MTEPHLGQAVIVNNIHSEMPGSAIDVEALVETLEKVGFEVTVHNDCDVRVRHVFTFLLIFGQLLRETVTVYLQNDGFASFQESTVN